MAKKKFYAVRKGTVTGIFETWPECQEAVKGYSNAEFKGFSSLEEAKNYIKDDSDTSKNNSPGVLVKPQINEGTHVKAYVDGSFDESLNRYSYGLVMISPDGSREEYFDFKEHNADVDSRNVSGELLGAMVAIEEAVKAGFESILIYHDYEGIAKWAKGEWKANKISSLKYVEFIKEYSTKIKILFEWVRGHSGNEFNEIADQLAKNALRKDSKPKFGDNNMVVDNLKLDDIEAIMELIKENEDYSIHVGKLEDATKITWQLLKGKERLVAIYYLKNRKFRIQGKPKSIFAVLSSFVLELVDPDLVIDVINPIYEIEIDKEDVDHEYNVHLPNKNIDFSPKLDNSFKQAIYNLQLEGEMYDYTYLSFPALRGLEGFMRLILSKYKIECEDSFNCFVVKDRQKETYKLDERYNKNVGSPKKIQYLNKLYDFYRKHRHTLFHWDAQKPGKHDTTRILNDKNWRIMITDTLDLVDNYFITK